MAIPHRRWLQFSLRGFIVVLTIGCIWLGWKVERARRQHDAVRAIEKLRGWVIYDWQEGRPAHVYDEPPSPHWLRLLFGDDFFQSAYEVRFEYRPVQEEFGHEVRDSIPYLLRIPTLKRVVLWCDASELEFEMTIETLALLESALPDCEVVTYTGGGHFEDPSLFRDFEDCGWKHWPLILPIAEPAPRFAAKASQIGFWWDIVASPQWQLVAVGVTLTAFANSTGPTAER
jgi:hypothetical protein